MSEAVRQAVDEAKIMSGRLIVAMTLHGHYGKIETSFQVSFPSKRDAAEAFSMFYDELRQKDDDLHLEALS